MGLLKSHKKTDKNKLGILIAVAVLFLSVVIAQPVGAATKVAAMSPANAASAFVYYKALRTCLTTGKLKNDSGFGSDSIGVADAQNFNWFHSGRTDVGVYGDTRQGGDGQWACFSPEGPSFIKSLASVTGYSASELLCAIGFTRQVNGANCSTITAGAQNDFIPPGNKGSAIDSWWANEMGTGSNNGPGGIGAGEYHLYFKSFTEACGVAESTNGSGEYTIMAPSTDGTALEQKKYIIVDRDKNTGTSLRLYSGTTITCGQLASRMASGASALGAYQKWLAIPGNNAGDALGDSPGEGEAGPTSCVVEGTGWIICSIAKTMGQMVDGIYAILATFLEVQPLQTDTGSQENFIYRIWSIIRSIANILFVIAFLIIIFSQLTSVGISNYGVKKLLPRLVVSAVLVNTSYWLSAILIDISNISGAGIYGLIHNITGNLGGIAVQTNLWEDIIVALLAGGSLLFVAGGGITAVAATAGGAVASAALWTVIPVVLGVLLAIVVAFAVLAARQALIIILVVLSPLAFVAYLLPNTENLFQLWKKSMTTMLVFYPIFAILFSGSQLAGYIIIASIDDGTEFKIPMIILGLFVMVAPLILTPMLVKFSGGLIGQLAGRINNSSKGLIDRSKKVASDKRKIAGGQLLNNDIASKNRFAQKTAGLFRSGFRGMQNSRRLDAEKLQAIEAQNQAAYDQTRQPKLDKDGNPVLDRYGRPKMSGSQQAYNATKAAKSASEIANNDAEATYLSSDKAFELTGDVEISKLAVDTLQGEHETVGLAAVNSDAASQQRQAALAGLKQEKSTYENERDARVSGVLNADAVNQGLVERERLAKQGIKTLDAERDFTTEEAMEHSTEYRSLQQRETFAKTGESALELEGEARTAKTLEGDKTYQDLAYRKQAAGAAKGVVEAREKADFRASLSPTQNIDPADPMAANIQAARDVELETNVARDRLASAEGVLQQDYAKTLTTDVAVAAEAGGIDPRGAKRVVTRAEQVVQEARQKAVGAEVQHLKLQGAKPTQLVDMISAGININGETANQDEIEAMIQYVGKVGTTEDMINLTDKMSDVRYTTTEGSPTVGGTATAELVERNKQIQQTFGEAVAASGAMSVSGKSLGDLAVGIQIPKYETEMLNTIRSQKYKGESFAKMDIDEMNYLNDLVSNPEFHEAMKFDAKGKEFEDGGAAAKASLYSAIERRLTDPILSAGLSGRDKNVYRDIQSKLGLTPAQVAQAAGASAPTGGGSGPGGIAIPGDRGEDGELIIKH